MEEYRTPCRTPFPRNMSRASTYHMGNDVGARGNLIARHGKHNKKGSKGYQRNGTRVRGFREWQTFRCLGRSTQVGATAKLKPHTPMGSVSTRKGTPIFTRSRNT